MTTRLLMESKPAYHLSTGGAPRRVYGARDQIQRNAHTLAVQATEGETAKHKQDALWAKDLRRGRLNLYGGLLRFLDLLHRKGVSKQTALMIPGWITEYIECVWSETPADATVSPKRAA